MGLLYSTFKHTSLVEHADKQMQHAGDLFKNHQSVMRSKDRTLAGDRML